MSVADRSAPAAGSATVREARAEAPYADYADLCEVGGRDFEGLILDLVDFVGTRREIEASCDLLAAAGRVEITGDRGWVDVSPILSDDDEDGARR